MVEEPDINSMGEQNIPAGGGLKKMLIWIVPIVIVVAVVIIFVMSGGDDEGDSEYYELVARANTAFNRESYEEARELYMQALERRSGDEVSKQRIAFIDSILALPEGAEEEEEAPAEVVEEMPPAYEPGKAEEDMKAEEKPAPEKKIVEEAEESVAKEKKAVAPKYKFHIVVGAFENRENAIKYSEELRDKGIDSKAIPIRGGSMTAVTYGSFNDREEAVRELRRVQREFEKNAWMLEF